jgi:predicted lipoprotein with Yx(FWY)xxD motif
MHAADDHHPGRPHWPLADGTCGWTPCQAWRAPLAVRRADGSHGPGVPMEDGGGQWLEPGHPIYDHLRDGAAS